MRIRSPLWRRCSTESAGSRSSWTWSNASTWASPEIPCSAHSIPTISRDASRHLALFLMQYWGGPRTYGEERGHPRLRMRHAPFVIGPAERDAWLRHMLEAVGELEGGARISEADAGELRRYLEMAADSLINTL